VRRYRFRLESVLRVRRLQEDVARSAFAEVTLAVGRSEADVASARAWLDGLRDEPPPTGPHAWEARRRVQLAAAEELAGRVTALDHARAEQRARQAALAEARTRVRALERLDERRRAEHAREAARLDERAVDDLVTSRYRRRSA
jgi:flagellar export protein FliJ